MAQTDWEEVKVDDAPPAGTVFKFDIIGTEFIGRFLRTETRTANFRDGSKEVTEYVFRGLKEDFVFSPPTHLAQLLAAAKLQPGHAVRIKFDSTLPTQKPGQSPMKRFKLQVNRAPPPSAPAVTPAASPPPAAAPARSAADDIPF